MKIVILMYRVAFLTGMFLTGSAQKVSDYIVKSLYKSSKSQNLLTSWHLKLFERNQFKNHPVVKKCSYLEEDVLMLELLLALWHPHLLHDLGLQGAHSVRQWHRHAKCLGYFKAF